MSSSPDVVVVGAGAAGLFAAMAAAEQGASVLVLEKTSRIGTKILISGGGKCNVAHAGPLEDVIRAFAKNEALFIRPSCYKMPNERIMRLFTEKGLELYARADGRVFPTQGDAKDVLNILLDRVLSLGVQICLNTRVSRIECEEGQAVSVSVLVEKESSQRPKVNTAGFGSKALLDRVLSGHQGAGEVWSGPECIPCKNVVVAVGGSSYPNSGTTGDGWKWARDLGHSVVKLRPALAPIYLNEPFVDLSGVSVQECRLIARVQGKRSAQASGDLLLTHHGISGPATLRVSREVALALESGPVQLELDLMPEDTVENLVQKLEGDLTFRQLLDSRVPARLAEKIAQGFLEASRLPLSKVGRKIRLRFAETLKGWQVGEVRAVPLEKGEVTAGGIALEEVDPKTMRSRIVKGLYLAGEILDVAGPVGGYNLQAAFATGYQAGETAARDALADSN